MSGAIQTAALGLGYGLAVLLFIGIAAAFFIAAASFTRDLWALPFLYELRRRSVFWIGASVGSSILVVTLWLFGLRYPTVPLFALLAVGPWLTVKLVRIVAWYADGAEIRGAALEIRVAEAIRLEESSPTINQRWPWSSYLTDVERARRRNLYEPPPI